MGESSWALRRAPELPDADFERWRQLLESRAGMVLDDRQRSFLQIQLAARMRELGHPVLLHEALEGGHAGGADALQRADTLALEYTFLWQQLAQPR